jgi:hypothetical protein
MSFVHGMHLKSDRFVQNKQNLVDSAIKLPLLIRGSLLANEL